MKKWHKILATVTVCLVFCSLLIGYATVNDTLNIFGSLSVSGVTEVELTSGESFSAILAGYDGVTTIIFDRYINQSAALNNAGLSWTDSTAIEVQSENSPIDSIKLFWDSSNATIYVLSKDSTTLFANTDCSNMFSPAEGKTSTLQTIVFNVFNTSNTVDMSGMFENCSSLTTIYAREDFNTGATFPDGGADNSADMFAGCYLLTGGEGTMVYPDGGTSTSQPTGCVRACIDNGYTKPGYFTDTTADTIIYFRSNLLKENGASYTVNGEFAKFTLANAVDSNVFSSVEIDYYLVYYIEKDGEWVNTDTQSANFFANGFYKADHTVAPITYDGTVYNKVKVLAQCKTGQLNSLEAIFEFTSTPHEISYSFDGYGIYTRIITSDAGGAYTFTWGAGISPDNSDPNRIFTNASISDTPFTAELEPYRVYEFYFIINDQTLLNDVKANEALIESLVGVVRN